MSYFLKFIVFFILINGFFVTIVRSQPGCSNPQLYYFDVDMDGYGNNSYDQGDEYRLYQDYISTNGSYFITASYIAYGCLELAEGAIPESRWVTNDSDCDDTDPDIYPGVMLQTRIFLF